MLFKLKIIILWACIAVLYLPAATAQYITEDDVDLLLDLAREQMEEENYEAANLTFRKILSLDATFPANMCYWFAETLFMIEQYQNAGRFLEKYLNLTGKAGDYYEQTLELQKFVSIKLNEIKSCALCDDKGYVWVRCSNCNGLKTIQDKCYYCKARGVVNCPECLGEGVLITEDVLGDPHYESCTRCNQKGYITCEVCHGALQIEQRCTVCKGAGRLSSDTICHHEAIH